MIRNYLLVAFRNLRRNKTFSLISIGGLAIGLAVFLMIFEYVAFEWNANRFHRNYDRLYRVVVNNREQGAGYLIQPGIAPLLSQKITGIESAVRVADGIGGGTISLQADSSNAVNTAVPSFREETMVYVDGNFLEAFTFPLEDGTTSLQEPNTMAISSSMAIKLFGETKVAGKTVTINDQFGKNAYTIKAVFSDINASSDIKANILLSIHTLDNPANRDGNDWADPNALESGFVNTYVVLKPGADKKSIAGQLTSLLHSIKASSKENSLDLQPFSALHLAPDFSYPYQTFGSLTLVALLFGVSMLILLIAWVNYINLSTVQALRRAKETGVRKVLGASRGQLSIQYLAETLLLTIASAGIALLLVQMLQQVYNGFTGKPLSLSILGSSWFALAAAALIIGGSLLSGGYVAFVLSSYKPIATIRGKIGTITKGLTLRKGLVVFQFTVSIVFIIATIIMYRQLGYMKGSNQGMQLNQLLVVKGSTLSTDEQAEKNVAFKNALVQLPFVTRFAGSNNIPGQGYNFSTDGIARLSPQPGDEKKNYNMFICDNNYFDTYGIQFAQGRSFTQNEVYGGWNKSRKVILNEKAAQQLGFAKGENIIGKKINWGKEFEIAGVVKDYHHLSMHKAIEPIVFLPSVSFVYFTLQTDFNNIQGKLATIGQLYKTYFPGEPFDYFFADETYNKQYQSDQQLGNVFIASAMVAVIIACLGLFGLAAFNTRQRIKEIGIRKVLGASVGSITQLLTKDFVKLVLISICIASPIAWWGMHKWLQDFAYHTSISWWVFALAGSMAVMIAVITVSFQAIKAAVSNPVKSLRTE